MTISKKSKVLFIDDDPYNSSSYVLSLRAQGLHVQYVKDVDQALYVAERSPFDAVVIDIMMPYGNAFDEIETAGGFKTGIALGVEMTDMQPDALLIALTNSQSADVEDWYTSREQFDYYCKRDVSEEEFAKIVWNRIHGIIELPQIFIVHGHDHEKLSSLKKYLQNALGFPEPIILAEKPSLSMTIIEKFEYYAKDSDVVFALFTPDDFKDFDTGLGRARQNVLFEYGYFLGFFGRRSGRVFLLHTQGAEIPSDLYGLIPIDITNGIETAGEEIRRELKGLFPSII